MGITGQEMGKSHEDQDRVEEQRTKNKEWAKPIGLSIFAKMEGNLDLTYTYYRFLQSL